MYNMISNDTPIKLIVGFCLTKLYNCLGGKKKKQTKTGLFLKKRYCSTGLTNFQTCFFKETEE